MFLEVGIGLALTVAVALAYQRGGGPIETASLKTYDALAHLAGPAPITDSVRIVAIDQESVESLGRWPWPRALTAQLIDQVVAAGARVIGLNVFLTDPDKNQGLEEIDRLQSRYQEILAKEKPLLQKKRINADDLQEFLDSDLTNARANLDGDSILAQSIEQAVNVVLPMYFIPGDALGKVDPLPAYFERDRIKLSGDGPGLPAGQAATLPLEVFGKVALAVGHANLAPDADGTLRRIPPAVRYGDGAYPSFAVQIVREYLRLQRSALKWVGGDTGFQLQKAKIPTDESGLTYVRFSGPAGTIKSYSAVNVLADGLPEKALANKIVLIGLTAPGAADGAVMVAPGGERITGLEIIANHIENILSQSFIQRPPWAGNAEWTLLGLAAFVVILVLPLMRARFAVPITAIFFAGTISVSAFLFIKKGLWVSPAYAATLLAVGFVVLVGKRLLFTERRKEMVEAEGMETNKMLGLSFQGQGMLDLAFEKFRRCPVDTAMKELLYNLGLDMERKRMFTKAAAVYEHIATVDPKYKDIADKIELLKKAGEGAVFGPLGKKGTDATVVVEGLGQSTTLGRYEVVKELGRGAMGIVYLGRDPKINRQVAIKTLRFTEETDEEQIKSVKERFFREAESAGNLTHPNIIRIFDAGEDQDVAYIAMELLEGDDLKKYAEKSNGVPLSKALEIIIQVAFGLDYAHKQGVVHRDIKPGNIFMLKDGSLRITDFGIARIQASSKTATGAVLGTPAYMSPEQVNGKKVDGRADIFSLGVTMYELLTGEKPFSAETIAALLYRIANVDQTDPRELNSKLPAALIPILSKALAKDPAARYQTAGELGTELREVVRHLTPDEASLKPPAVVSPEVAAASRTIVEQPYTDAAGKSAPPAAAPARKAEPSKSNSSAPERAVSTPAPAPTAEVSPAPEPVASPPLTPAPLAPAETPAPFTISQEPHAASAADDNGQMTEVLRAAFEAGGPSLPTEIETKPAPADEPPAGFETTRLTSPDPTPAAPLEPPAGFEATQLMEKKADPGKPLTESDFLSELEQTFKAPAPENAPPKNPIPFRIVQNNDIIDNTTVIGESTSAEDAFLQALNQELPAPDGPPQVDKAAGDDTQHHV